MNRQTELTLKMFRNIKMDREIVYFLHVVVGVECYIKRQS